MIDLKIFDVLNDGSFPLGDCRSAPGAIMKRMCEFIKPRVLEIGTAYGKQLQYFSSQCELVYSIDCMYDWVPNIRTEDKFNPELVNEDKFASWKENSTDNCCLIIGSSYEVYSDPVDSFTLSNVGGFDVLIIDGDHSSIEGISSDYFNYKKFLKQQHIVLFDDIQIKKVKQGVDVVIKKLVDSSIQIDKKNIKVSGTGVETTVLIVKC